MAIRVAFLDRDGTINVDHGYVHRWEQFELVPGALDGLRILRDGGFRLAIVTNQSGIARGFYSEQEVLDLHQQLADCLRREGIVIDAIAYCPHVGADCCSCRKPAIGLAENVARQLGEEIDFSSSWMIGDRLTDVQFGQALRMKTAYLDSSHTASQEWTTPPNIIARDLHAAARQICPL